MYCTVLYCAVPPPVPSRYVVLEKEVEAQLGDSPLSDDEFLVFRSRYAEEEVEEDDDRDEYFVNLLFKHFLERETVSVISTFNNQIPVRCMLQ